MLRGFVGCCQIGFMRLQDNKNDLVTKHSHDAFIITMYMMNIFVVCFLQKSCRCLHKFVHLVVPKKIFSAGNISFWTDSSSFEWFVCHLFLGWSVHRPSVWLLSVIHRTCSTWNSFVHSAHAFVFLIGTMFLQVQGWIP